MQPAPEDNYHIFTLAYFGESDDASPEAILWLWLVVFGWRLCMCLMLIRYMTMLCVYIVECLSVNIIIYYYCFPKFCVAFKGSALQRANIVIVDCEYVFDDQKDVCECSLVRA